ncbi:MAG: hypothetical protein N4A31_00795 [Rickettsiales bacterium]|jgi:hypothetical protein|nr:hypothetical protein [Rickettsiales bacterium]
MKKKSSAQKAKKGNKAEDLTENLLIEIEDNFSNSNTYHYA